MVKIKDLILLFSSQHQDRTILVYITMPNNFLDKTDRLHKFVSYFFEDENREVLNTNTNKIIHLLL